MRGRDAEVALVDGWWPGWCRVGERSGWWRGAGPRQVPPADRGGASGRGGGGGGGVRAGRAGRGCRAPGAVVVGVGEWPRSGGVPRGAAAAREAGWPAVLAAGGAGGDPGAPVGPPAGAGGDRRRPLGRRGDRVGRRGAGPATRSACPSPPGTTL